MIKISLIVLALVTAAGSPAGAELLNGRMIFNSSSVKVMGLKTASGLVALSHSPEMKLGGVASLSDLKVCDELDVDVADSGPARVIKSITYTRSGKPADCPFPVASMVTAADLYRVLKDKSAVVYDVRNAEEFNTAHFDGAISLPVTEVAGRLKEFPVDKPVILYCATARRLAYAAAMLLQSGIRAGVVKGNFVVKDGKPQIEE